MKVIFLFAALLLGAQSPLAAQCLSLPACPVTPQTVCDLSDNDPFFWNNPIFFDPVIESHNLSDAPADLSMQLSDTCGAGDVSVSYVLLLDLDGNGSRETAVSSDLFSGEDLVYFGNATNPNYSGGDPRHFDTRVLPQNERYRFALEKTVQGSLVTARVRWATPLAPVDYVQPQLPAGTHRIEWRFEKNGEVKTCGYNFTVKDCKSPTVACLPGLSVNIMPTQMIQLWATDFLQSALDNYTPASQLKFGIRKSGTGTGFPVNAQGEPITNVIYTCADLGTQPVEFWAIDRAGNADYCETYVLVQDNNGNCEPPQSLFACATSACTGTGIEDVSFQLSGGSNAIPPFTIFSSGSGNSGCATFPYFPLAANLVITPILDSNPLNGVTTFDLVLISRHILGLEPLNNPYKLIAADANKSGSVTTFDIVELRKLILGYFQELPNNTSWRFVDKAFVFPNPNNPFQTVFPESITSTVDPNSLNFKFVGIKIGDVNCSAIANLSGSTSGAEALVIPDQQLRAGEITEVPVHFAAANSHYGFQFGLHFDPAQLKVLEVLPGLGAPDNFGVFPDRMTASWSAAEPVVSWPDEPVVRLRIQALQPLQLAEALRLDPALRPEAYPENEERVPLELQFVPQEAAPGGQIFAPQPNPTTAGVRIPLRLEQPAAMTLEILDGTGRLMLRQEQPADAGAQFLQVPATAFPQAGVYCWRLRVGTELQTGKIVRQ